jgi:hypothetical protein
VVLLLNHLVTRGGVVAFGWQNALCIIDTSLANMQQAIPILYKEDDDGWKENTALCLPSSLVEMCYTTTLPTHWDV